MIGLYHFRSGQRMGRILKTLKASSMETNCKQSEKDLLRRRETLERELTDLRIRHQKLGEETMAVFRQIEGLNEDIDQLTLESAIAGPSIDWAWLLRVDERGRASKIRRNAAKDQVANLATIDGHIGVSLSGYSPSTRQHALRIALVRDSDSVTHAVHDALSKLLPHITPTHLPDREKSVVFIDVLEHTLSEYGYYRLALIPSDDYFALERTGYGKTQTMTQKKSLSDLLAHVQRHHYADISLHDESMEPDENRSSLDCDSESDS